MREKRPLAFGGVFVLGSGFCLVFLFGFGVACVLFPSSCCASFPFNDDLGTPPTRRPHSWKKNAGDGKSSGSGGRQSSIGEPRSRGSETVTGAQEVASCNVPQWALVETFGTATGAYYCVSPEPATE